MRRRFRYHDRVVSRIPRPIGTAVFLLAWLMPWRPAFRTRARDSKLSFYVHWRDLIGRHIAKYGVHEPLLTGWIADYLESARARGVFVDVGANLGWHAVHAAIHENVETVVAFEPDPFNARLLDRNLAVNEIKKAVVVDCAIGAERGTARMYRYRSTNYGRHNLMTDYGYGSNVVRVSDLDSALGALGLAGRRVLVMKVDVEGYEPAVIAGAARTLTHTDAVVLEYSPDLGREGGLSARDMVEQLFSAGFLPHCLAGGTKLAEITSDELNRVSGQLDLVWLRPEAAGK